MDQCCNTRCLAVFTCCLLLTVGSALAGCGGYQESVSAGQSFRITSPNYPSQYARNQRCIWLFTAAAGTNFVVNVTSVQLEGAGNDADGCKDYLQITDGSSKANQLAYLCQVSNSDDMQLIGNRLYLWIKFQSDFQDQSSGFDLTVYTVKNSNASGNGTPVISCNTTRYTCPNKECIYQGSICDSVNDCGCDDYGCDETMCWKFDLLNIWGIGVSVGLAISVSAFIICGFLEMPERKRPECLRRRPEAPACLGACGKKNRIQQQQTSEDAFMSMMKRMTGGNAFKWDAAESESEAATPTSRSGTPRTSVSGPVGSGSSPTQSRRSSLYTQGGQQTPVSVYGNTLSPKDSLKVATASAKAAQQQQQQGPSSSRLTVPGTAKM